MTSILQGDIHSVATDLNTGKVVALEAGLEDRRRDGQKEQVPAHE
jgi:hypothetical protein